MAARLSEEQLYALRFPVGEFEIPPVISAETRAAWIEDIKHFPKLIRAEAESLTAEQLELTYRPGGWNIRQVIQHCADSHMNSVARFKLALTEENPNIRPYDEAAWAELPDSLGPLNLALNLLDALHERWVFLLESLTEDQLKRTFYHPVNEETTNLAETIGTYAWHCRHHLGHVRLALSQQ